MTTAQPQQFCVRWNSYPSNLQSAFPKLLVSEHFVDVTLACENEMLKCHKIVLSACSTYFEKLLLDNPCQHPIIFMKDMKFQELQSLVDFMYKGEVNVTQDDLSSLLKSAEALQIRGLSGSDQLLNQNFPNIKNEEVNGQANKQSTKQEQQTNHQQQSKANLKKEVELCEQAEQNPSSSECDSNDVPPQKSSAVTDHEYIIKEEYYEQDSDLMDTYLEEDATPMNSSDVDKTPDFAIANVSCQYDGSPGAASRRVRRSDEELRRAAECITRGQTFQTVSDQFNIPISTIRFYMARKGILPRRKRGRSCAGSSLGGGGNSLTSTPVNAHGGSGNAGNTSPLGPPFHIVHYKLPPLGVSPKLK